MVGRGRRRCNAKRAHPETEVLSTEKNNSKTDAHSPRYARPKEQELIEISSSQQESSKKRPLGDEKNQLGMDNEFAMGKEKHFTHAVEQMTNAVTNLAKIFVNQPPTIFPIFSPVSHTIFQPVGSDQQMVPLLVNSLHTPKNSSITNNSATDHIMAKLKRESQHEKSISAIREKSTTTAAIGKKLFSPTTTSNSNGTDLPNAATPRSCYISKRSPSSVRLARKNGCSNIPFWMPVLFRPPQEMILNDDEVALAAYIFGPNMCEEAMRKEVLVSSTYCDGDREALTTLIPKEPIDETVLNLLACMLTHELRSISKYPSYWFLPTSFSQLAISGSRNPQTLREFYANDFMGKVEFLSKVFIPMNEDNLHWYLVVIDLNKRQLVFLDSKPSAKMKQSRKRTIRKLGIFVEEMLTDETFYDFDISTRPVISDFSIYEPEEVGQQRDGSNDCGVWVATWMKECTWCDDYRIKVNDASRMQLALDLVLKPFNQKRDTVTNLAKNYFKKFEDKQKRLVKD